MGITFLKILVDKVVDGIPAHEEHQQAPEEQELDGSNNRV